MKAKANPKDTANYDASEESTEASVTVVDPANITTLDELKKAISENTGDETNKATLTVKGDKVDVTGEDVTIGANQILVVDTGAKLTVTGTLTNSGKITNKGTITGTGKIINAGTIEDSGSLVTTVTITRSGTGTYTSTSPKISFAGTDMTKAKMVEVITTYTKQAADESNITDVPKNNGAVLTGLTNSGKYYWLVAVGKTRGNSTNVCEIIRQSATPICSSTGKSAHALFWEWSKTPIADSVDMQTVSSWELWVSDTADLATALKTAGWNVPTGDSSDGLYRIEATNTESLEGVTGLTKIGSHDSCGFDR